MIVSNAFTLDIAEGVLGTSSPILAATVTRQVIRRGKEIVFQDAEPLTLKR